MGLTNVKACGAAMLRSDRRVDAESVRTGENETGFSRFKSTFFQKLRKFQKAEDWLVFACTEANAAYLLTVSFDTRLKHVLIEKSVDVQQVPRKGSIQLNASEQGLLHSSG